MNRLRLLISIKVIYPVRSGDLKSFESLSQYLVKALNSTSFQDEIKICTFVVERLWGSAKQQSRGCVLTYSVATFAKLLRYHGDQVHIIRDGNDNQLGRLHNFQILVEFIITGRLPSLFPRLSHNFL